jgi:hypothetical protein
MHPYKQSVRCQKASDIKYKCVWCYICNVTSLTCLKVVPFTIYVHKFYSFLYKHNLTRSCHITFKHLPLIPYVRRVPIKLLREMWLTYLITELLMNVIHENYRNTTFTKLPQHYESRYANNYGHASCWSQTQIIYIGHR